MFDGLACVPKVMRIALPTSINKRPTAAAARVEFICSRVPFIKSQR